MPAKPEWLKVKFNQDLQEQEFVNRTLRQNDLTTVCEEAGCPNRCECWASGTATFMLLGDRCSRNCRFCSVDHGPCQEALSPEEPKNVARAVKQLELDYVVLTSVTRDDLPDGGAEHWLRTIEQVRELNPGVQVETLVPDFAGCAEDLDLVLDTEPEMFNHNVETVPRLYSRVRPQASYSRSLDVLERSAARELRTKSGLMLGLGEKNNEVVSVLEDLYERGVRYLTLGQYLQPAAENLEVDRWVPPEEFEQLKERALKMGFTHVESGPLVRSSYHAAQQFES